MSKNAQVSSGNAGFCGLLTIVFITLKLCSVIEWSWWWVVSPMWIPLAIIFGLFVIVAIGGGILYLVASVIDKIQRKKRRRHNNFK
jgi:hypothetical protein